MKIKSLLIIALCLGFFSANAQYISEIIEFKPAPGQFINKSPGLIWTLSISTGKLVCVV